jgi:hypothetical protein
MQARLPVGIRRDKKGPATPLTQKLDNLDTVVGRRLMKASTPTYILFEDNIRARLTQHLYLVRSVRGRVMKARPSVDVSLGNKFRAHVA